jgi:aspartate kinase
MSQKISVLKFGGTSVGDTTAIRRVVQIITTASHDRAVVAVVSAMSGVTNRLIEAAHQSSRKKVSAVEMLREFLQQRHFSTTESLIIDKARCRALIADLKKIIDETIRLCHELVISQDLTPAVLDVISSVGERLSARIIAATLSEQGVDGVPVDSTEIVVTDENFGDAGPITILTRERTRHRLLPFIQANAIPVVTGFIGATLDGRLTTLGRGGSDLSATILGAALDASEVVIWSDVDGVLTADPGIVPEARTLPSISYQEATYLASFGAKVLHPKTLQPVIASGIPVYIRNTFAPERPGTRVTSDGSRLSGKLKAISALDQLSLLNIRFCKPVQKAGFAAQVLSAMLRVRPDVLLLSEHFLHDDISLLAKTPESQQVVDALEVSLSSGQICPGEGQITVESDKALVALVGEGLRGQPGVAGKVFSALGRERIGVRFVAQGLSDHGLLFVLEAAEMEKAVALLHREFGLEAQDKGVVGESTALGLPPVTSSSAAIPHPGREEYGSF